MFDLFSLEVEDGEEVALEEETTEEEAAQPAAEEPAGDVLFDGDDDDIEVTGPTSREPVEYPATRVPTWQDEPMWWVQGPATGSGKSLPEWLPPQLARMMQLAPGWRRTENVERTPSSKTAAWVNPQGWRLELGWRMQGQPEFETVNLRLIRQTGIDCVFAASSKTTGPSDVLRDALRSIGCIKHDKSISDLMVAMRVVLIEYPPAEPLNLRRETVSTALQWVPASWRPLLEWFNEQRWTLVQDEMFVQGGRRAAWQYGVGLDRVVVVANQFSRIDEFALQCIRWKELARGEESSVVVAFSGLSKDPTAVLAQLTKSLTLMQTHRTGCHALERLYLWLKAHGGKA